VAVARCHAPVDIVGIALEQRWSKFMADIVFRNLDDNMKEALRLRAARKRRSMNAELSELVRLGLANPDTSQPTTPARATPTLQALGAEIRALSAAQAQTPSEELLHAARDER
jgi:plasmid stability protein